MGLDADAKGQKQRPAERLDLDTAMRRWAAHQNAVVAAQAAQERKRQRRKPAPKPPSGEQDGV